MKRDANDAVASPCIDLCRIDPASGLCSGCWRSIDEITRWGSADSTARRTILSAVARRRAECEGPIGDSRVGAESKARR